MFEQRNSKQSWFASTKAKKMKSHRCRTIGPRDCKQRERSTHASALRFLALLAHSPRFGAHKERPEDNATTQLTKRQSPQLAVGHEDDITCFTIVPWILYAPLRPLPMLFDVCFTFPFDFFSFSLSTLASASWYKNMQMSRDEISTPVVPSFLLSLPLPLTSQLRLLVLASWPLFRRQEELHDPLDRPNLLHGPDVSIYKRGSRPLITVTL